MNKTIYSTIAALGLAVATNAEQVKFTQLPNAVQKTINRQLYGGMVQEIDRKSQNGRTVYLVEIRREGRNRHIRVDGDGKLLPRDEAAGGSATVDIDVDRDGRDVFDKNDGKILGVVDNPNDNDDFKAEAKVGDDGVKIETDVDKPRDRGVTEDVFDKNDGKILDVLPAPGKNKIEVDADVDNDVDLDGGIDVKTRKDRGLNAEVEVDADGDDGQVSVKANEGKGKGIFRKGDGKILGIPIPGRRADREAAVRTERDAITTDADGGLDTDKNDGRVLGVPKRGFETLSLNEVPPVVRETIRREAGGYKIAEIERATLEGRTVYEVDIERDGGNREMHIAPDGNILKDSDREALGSPARRERGQGTQPPAQ